MKFFILILFASLCSVTYGNERDSLLNALDESLSKRQIYIQQKEDKLRECKSIWEKSKNKEEQFLGAKRIMDEYIYFISDSALYYSKVSLDLAVELNNEDYILEMKMKRAYLLSLLQLYYESFKIMESIQPEKISLQFKKKYYNTYLLIYHNRIKDLDDLFYHKQYREEQLEYINAYLAIGNKDELQYQTVLAYKYYINGMVEESVDAVILLLNNPQINPHMHAEFLYNLGGVLWEAGAEYRPRSEKYLIEASIEYNQLAIKKNPPLMYLAMILQQEGYTDKAHAYMNMAMEDTRIFSNSHRYGIAEKIHTLIQNTYYDKINEQQESLQSYSVLITIFFVLLFVMLIFIYKHNQVLNKTKLELSKANSNLKEQNLVKEIYIGRYLTIYSTYIAKFEDYRRFFIRKLKSGNYDDLLKSENELLDNQRNEVDLLFIDFDNTFFELYPNFIESVNHFLLEDSRYTLKDEKKMNTELRILALLKLGISENKMISSFLRITVQSVYNYRSKIKAKAINENDFEDEVRRIIAV